MAGRRAESVHLRRVLQNAFAKGGGCMSAQYSGNDNRKKKKSAGSTFVTVIAGLLTAIIACAVGMIIYIVVVDDPIVGFGFLSSEPETENVSDILPVFADHDPEFYDNIIASKIPEYGNKKKYIAIHYLGVNAQNNTIEADGEGAHFYIYWDGTIYQAAGLDAVTWHVGTSGGTYTQIHDEANNYNTIGIEMCAKCDGDATNDRDEQWYITEETQEACVLLVRYLMKELGIPKSHVLRHGDIVNKWCPAPYFTNNGYNGSWTWDIFREKLAALPRSRVPEFPVRYDSE